MGVTKVQYYIYRWNPFRKDPTVQEKIVRDGDQSMCMGHL